MLSDQPQVQYVVLSANSPLLTLAPAVHCIYVQLCTQSVQLYIQSTVTLLNRSVNALIVKGCVSNLVHTVYMSGLNSLKFGFL